MAQSKPHIYSFRIYLVWQGLLILSLGCALGAGLFVLVLQSGLDRWLPVRELGTAILIATIFATSLLTRKWLSVPADFIIGANALEIILARPRRFLQPSDQLIFWNQLAEWQEEPAHSSVHAIAPPIFKIKLSDGRKISFMIADNMAVYQSFLIELATRLQELNQKNAAIGQIRRQVEFSKSKAGFWFIAISAVLIFIGGNCIFFLPLNGKTDMQGNWEIYLGAMAMSFFILMLGFLARRRGKKEEEPGRV